MTSSKVKPKADPPTEPARRPLRGRRALQAEQTRLDILDAARHRFAAQGYVATTLKDIAGDASVSVQTVYDSVGGKPELVRQLNDLIDAEAGIAEIAVSLGSESDPAVVARIPARITRRLVEHCGDILRATLAGSFAESGLGPILNEGQRRHRAGATAVARRLAELGALRPDLTPAVAAKTLAALTDFRLALILTDEHSMNPDRLEAWIADTTSRSLLDPRRVAVDDLP